MDTGNFVVGLEHCRACKEDEFDRDAVCTVRWSLHRPGSVEQLGKSNEPDALEKEVAAEKAYVWVVLKGPSEPRRMTIADALWRY